jgi:hypothetical protein
VLVVTGVAIRLAAADPGADRLAAAEAGPAPAVTPEPTVLDPGAPRLLAVGIATIDLDRAAAAFGGLVERLPDDELLGARAARPVAPLIALLEPATEGRMAATLARAGEGPAALYLAIPPHRLGAVAARVRRVGASAVAGNGPLGPQLLVRGGPAWGPHLLLVARPEVG